MYKKFIDYNPYHKIESPIQRNTEQVGKTRNIFPFRSTENLKYHRFYFSPNARNIVNIDF